MPKVWLILGATGFIGRHVVSLLVNSGETVYCSDKVVPEIAYLSAAEKEAFAKAHFSQKNLVNPAAVEAYMKEVKPNYVINLAAETKYGHTDEVYDERVYKLSMTVAKAALAAGVEKFVELSTAQVYEPTQKAKAEGGKIEPWTKLAEHKYRVEKDLQGLKELRWVVLRPAIVYGPGDRNGIMPRVICGAVYKHLGEKMTLLWNEDLKVNTVHVADVARAIRHVAEASEKHVVYNLADKDNSDQGSTNKLLEEVFDIRTDCMGKLKSAVATKVAMATVVSGVNDKHISPWSEMCRAKDIVNTPLSPFLDAELLLNKSLTIDGTAIEKTGFKYEHPHITANDLRDMVTYYIDLKLFPSGFMK